MVEDTKYEKLLGAFIGSGKHREVYIHKKDSGLVIKKAKYSGAESCNVAEMDTWLTAKQHGLSDILAPCVELSPCGKYLVQVRGSSIEDNELPEPQPVWLPDTHRPEQWVYINNKIVCCDYSLHGKNYLLKDTELLIFTCCNEKYEYFIPLFCHFIQHSNPKAKIEIATTNPDKYSKLFPDVLFTKLAINKPDYMRFILEPITKCKYTYITDIDILITEDILKFHKNKVSDSFPISNVMRISADRLTGLHFVKTKPYYEKTRLARKYAKMVGDEHMLFNICSSCWDISRLKVTKISQENRPLFGIHCSPNREYVVGWAMSKEQKKEAIKILSYFNKEFLNNIKIKSIVEGIL